MTHDHTDKDRSMIPDKVFTQHTIALGKTGKGKTYGMRGAVERFLDKDRRTCILDPKGDWWGLRVGADGKSKGYPVVIFGGDHADVPIDGHSGAAIGELIATGNRPAVIDLSTLTIGERTRFFMEFAAALFRHNRAPLMLVIDEVHNFAPQMGGGGLNPDMAKMLHWANRLASEGRGRGITLFTASQRPQKVHKDLVTCHETLIALGVVHTLDRKAIKEWMDGAGDPERSKAVLDSLAGLQRGEAFVWSPELGYFEKIKFPKIKTFDSMAGPSAQHASLSGWADIDLEEVKAKLGDAVKEAEANDPKKLRARIAELERAADRPREEPGTAEIIEQNEALMVERDGLRNALAKANGHIEDLSREVSSYHEAVHRARMALNGISHDPAKVVSHDPVHVEPATPPPRTFFLNEQHTERVPKRPQSLNGHAKSTPAGMPRPQTEILKALGWWASLGVDRPKREQVAWVAGASPSSSAYANNLGALRTSGFIDYPGPGLLCLTSVGRKHSQPDETPYRGALPKYVERLLSGPQMAIFSLLWRVRKPMSREAVAKETGASASSSAFANNLGAMRTLGLIDYPATGQVGLSELFT